MSAYKKQISIVSVLIVVVTLSACGRSDYSVEEYVSNWEAVRMEQTSWAGADSDTVWEQDQNDYFSSSNTIMGDTVTLSGT